MTTELEFTINTALDAFASIIVSNRASFERSLWLVDDKLLSRQDYGSCLTLYEQLGIESNDFIKVFGRYWRSPENFKKIEDLMKSFRIVELSYGVRFIAVSDTDLSPDDIRSMTTLELNDTRCIQIGKEVRNRVEKAVKIFQANADASTSNEDEDMDTSNDRETSMVSNGSSLDTSNDGDEDEEMDTNSLMSIDTQTSMPLENMLFDDDGYIRKDISKALMKGFKSRKELKPHEMNLLGCIFKKALNNHYDKSFKELKSILLPTSSGPCKVTVVPSTYKQNANSKPESIARTKRRHMLKVTEYVSLLQSPALKESMIEILFQENPIMARGITKRFFNKHCRLGIDQTIAHQVYVGFNDYKTKLFQRNWRYESGGFLLFANPDKVAAAKKHWFNQTFRTLMYMVKRMQKVVKCKGGPNKVRDQKVLVTSVRPIEQLMLSALNLLNSGQFVSGNKCFRTPWNVHDDFSDSLVVKFSIDAGGGSTKMILNIVNVAKPQSMEHVRVVFHFKGVKDTEANVRIAAFEEDSIIRRDMEAVCNRRCVILTLPMQLSQDVKTTQLAVAINSDSNHNIHSPQPLPKPSGTTLIRAEEISDDNKMGIVLLDFTSVTATKILVAGEREVLGFSFFGGSSNECLATVLFREPMKCQHLSVDTVPMGVEQILAGGVLSADLAFLSTFIGHQGASARNPCVFCLALLCNMKNIFCSTTPAAARRTMQSIMQDYEQFEDLYENQPEQLRTKALRTRVTQNNSHSIAHMWLAFIPIILVPLLHVRIGITRSILDMVFDFCLKIEQLYDGDNPKTEQSARLELNKLIAFNTWLDQHNTDIDGLIQEEDEQMKAMMMRLSRIQDILDNPRYGEATKATYQAKLAEAEADMKELEEQQMSDDEIDLAVQLSELKPIVENNIVHLRQILAKHGKISKSIIVQVLKKNGVDIQVYFSGVINGPDCFQLAKKAQAIMEGITKAMLEEFGDDARLNTAMVKFNTQMQAILLPWYDIKRFMTATGRHSQQAMSTFEADITRMKTAILDLVVESPPLEGDENPIRLPTTLKCHDLFDFNDNGESPSHIVEQVRQFECTGNLDEQNIEMTHAVYNQLQRNFGNIRGRQQSKMCFREIHLRNRRVVREAIEKMKAATSREPRSGQRTAPQVVADDREDETDIVDLPFDDLESLPSNLQEHELDINENAALRGPTNTQHDDYDSLSEESKKLLLGMHTKIVACPCCQMRFVGTGACRIHCYDAHDLSKVVFDGESVTTVTTVR